jgi:hypothetical protein
MVIELARCLVRDLPLFALVAAATHLVVSGSQTLLHYGLGHHRIGGVFFRNHIKFHHTYYARGHLVSPDYRTEEGNNTPYFLIPTVVVAGAMFFVLPLDLFFLVAVVSAASFHAHVLFDKAYHVEGSRLERFAWFRRKRELHFVHHLHANSNFAVIHFFWDRLLRTYRGPDGEVR